MATKASKPPMADRNTHNKSSISPMRDNNPPISRFEVMKSKRHQLNTILNDYNDTKGSNVIRQSKRKQLNQMGQKFNNRNNSHHKAISLQGEPPNSKMNSKFLLSEYSEFLKHSGMTDYDPFRKSVSPEIDRKNDVSDIDGASAFNKQLSTTKPINTNYDKLETFQNQKKTFLMRRAEAGNLNSKRCMRIDDIDGAIPKQKTSITESQRIKITSADLRDLISEMDNYRKRQLSKNGYINLFARNKPDVP